jgi:hypothetical protein
LENRFAHGAIVLGVVIQAADAIDDSGQPPEQDRDETGNDTKNESWRRGLPTSFSRVRLGRAKDLVAYTIIQHLGFVGRESRSATNLVRSGEAGSGKGPLRRVE